MTYKSFTPEVLDTLPDGDYALLKNGEYYKIIGLRSFPTRVEVMGYSTAYTRQQVLAALCYLDLQIVDIKDII